MLNNLTNQTMIEAAMRIEQIVIERLRTASADDEVEFISFDTNGITGHIDHIVASRAVLLAYYRLKANHPRVKRVRLSCLTSQELPEVDTSWIYMDPGRHPNEISELIDATMFHEQILEIMRSHHSQRNDCEHHIQSRGKSLGINTFIVVS